MVGGGSHVVGVMTMLQQAVVTPAASDDSSCSLEVGAAPASPVDLTSRHQTPHRLAFSVDNILDPNKFTGNKDISLQQHTINQPLQWRPHQLVTHSGLRLTTGGDKDHLVWSVVSCSEFVGPNRFRLVAIFSGAVWAVVHVTIVNVFRRLDAIFSLSVCGQLTESVKYGAQIAGVVL
ncbi:hypothetical protein AAG570_009679 [Ranatra chinensis]|uniref:Uncharacterized protein n=1 Tax=Ranatra chinensis TaxID=642074 RepID=A0ABD0ZD24_9HEMI